MIGYLSEFWDSITQVVVAAGTYTTAWFESVGNAVAGAVGNMLLPFLQYFVDTYLGVAWIMDNLGSLIGSFLLPIKYIYIYLSAYFSTIVNVEAQNLWTQDTQILTFVKTIPYFNTIGITIYGLIIFLSAWFLLRKLNR